MSMYMYMYKQAATRGMHVHVTTLPCTILYPWKQGRCFHHILQRGHNIMPLTHFECRIQILSCATPCSLLFFVTWTRFGDSVHNIMIILYMTLYVCDVKISHLSKALGPCRGSARPTHSLSFSSSFLCHINRLSAQCSHDIYVCVCVL